MKKKIGDYEEKFGDFPYFDLSIRSILLSFTPWNPVHNPHYLQLPAGRYLSPGLGRRSGILPGRFYRTPGTCRYYLQERGAARRYLVERLTYDPNLTTGASLLREATLIQEIIVTHSDVEDAEDARCA